MSVMCPLIMEHHEDHILEVSNLSVKISNQIVLDNVDFKLRKAATLAVIGPNGAGKTVLFRSLLNLIPHSGKIEWKEKVNMGYVPQILSVRDLPISVREFLAFRSRQNIEGSLDSVGLDNEILNKNLGVLSGGQLRRVLIAWAILGKPNVLLFDEPTTGVDLDSEEAIYVRLRRLTKENRITLLMISHSRHIVNEYSDYMLALNKCVTFFGESKEIMNPSIQKMIYGEPICLLKSVV